MTKEIVLVDMVSHSEMHLPFNEGYVKAMSLAYPDKAITFAACDGHVKNIRAQVGVLSNVKYRVIPQFDELLSHHSYHQILQMQHHYDHLKLQSHYMMMGFLYLKQQILSQH